MLLLLSILSSGLVQMESFWSQNLDLIYHSDGFRGCIGQQFAMVELCVSIAIILKEHKIELALEGDDSSIVTEDDKKLKWEAARDHAFYQLSGGIKFNDATVSR